MWSYPESGQGYIISVEYYPQSSTTVLRTNRQAQAGSHYQYAVSLHREEGADASWPSTNQAHYDMQRTDRDCSVNRLVIAKERAMVRAVARNSEKGVAEEYLRAYARKKIGLAHPLSLTPP